MPRESSLSTYHAGALRVAVLGTGRMGSEIARRLDQAGFDLLLWNRTRSKAERLGIGRIAATAASAVANADVVITSLADADAVREVYHAEDGALKGARGQTFVETSTLRPATILELAAELTRRGSAIVEAPILGAAPTLDQGHAVLLISGERDRIERVIPVLEAVGTVLEVGELGKASQLKLLSNCLVATQNVLAAELLNAADTRKLERQTVLDLLERQAPGLAVRRMHYLSSRDQHVVFTIAGMVKDLRLALDEFSTAKMPITSQVHRLLATAAKAKSERDLAAIVETYDTTATDLNGAH